MKLFIWITLPLLALTWSCDTDRLYEENQMIDQSSWHQDSLKTFEFDISDTTNWYNIFLNVRHRNDYAYRNLHVNVTAEFPDGNTYKELVSVLLADPYGKWLGSGFGDLRNYSAMFKLQTKLPAGHYQFKLQQAMREEQLDGVADIGIRVQESL